MEDGIAEDLVLAVSAEDSVLAVREGLGDHADLPALLPSRPSLSGKRPPFARSCVVPRYYFNVRGDAFEEEDVVGRLCPNEVAALSHALSSASLVLQKRLLAEGLSSAGSIEVEDEQHRPVLSLPIRAAAY
jgi:hypothetical protein